MWEKIIKLTKGKMFSKNSWFFEEFGEEESELIRKKGWKIIDPKFNIFQIGEKKFYGGRFECLTLEKLKEMLNSLKNKENICKKEEYIYGCQPTPENNISNKECFADPIQEEAKNLEIETDITQEKPINELPKSPEIKIKTETKASVDISPEKNSNHENSPTKLNENKNLSGFEKEMKIGLRFKNLPNKNVKSLICSPENYGAVFQVASQFNCLEMIGPSVTPEQGITKYVYDDTQGPACALSCRSALFYRNYLVNTKNGIGQSEKNQINTLDELEIFLNNKQNKFWYIQNGYFLTWDENAVEGLNTELKNKSDLQQKMKEKIKVGIHWDTEVNIKKGQNVCQVFCSTLAINYDKSVKHPRLLWSPFCPLLLEAQYEATFAVGCILAHMKQERVKVFLTAIGGGVFGNPKLWIADAIAKNLEKYKNEPIDVYLVHYSSIADQFKKLG